jgi:hypothetical protein
VCQQILVHAPVKLADFVNIPKIPVVGTAVALHIVYPGPLSHKSLFDHNGEKKFLIGQNLDRAWDVLVAEAKKCVIRCANCHRTHSVKTRATPTGLDRRVRYNPEYKGLAGHTVYGVTGPM